MLKIGQAAKQTGISVHALRYYEKEGLLNFVERSKSGIRLFKDKDMEWLSVITCLKGTGMPIKDIKEFMALCQQGDASLPKRLEIFVEHKRQVEQKIAEMRQLMEKIDYKIWYYTTAVAAGTETIHKQCGQDCLGKTAPNMP